MHFSLKGQTFSSNVCFLNLAPLIIFLTGLETFFPSRLLESQAHKRFKWVLNRTLNNWKGGHPCWFLILTEQFESFDFRCEIHTHTHTLVHLLLIFSFLFRFFRFTVLEISTKLHQPAFQSLYLLGKCTSPLIYKGYTKGITEQSSQSLTTTASLEGGIDHSVLAF